jgi:hypothetical protein
VAAGVVAFTVAGVVVLTVVVAVEVEAATTSGMPVTALKLSSSWVT